MTTTTEKTYAYIREHPHIQSSLRKGVINYSALARLISSDLEIEKETSKEAILIAARRYRDLLKKEDKKEAEIKDVLANSEVGLRTKMEVIILEKTVNYDHIEEVQKLVKKESGTIYVIEGSKSYTVIMQERHTPFLKERVKSKIVKTTQDAALITLMSGKEIEKVSGVVSYLTSLFAENGVNILEVISCWTDTLFVVQAKDVPNVMQFLQF